ncbi:MAG: hypothetical protein ACI9G1_002678 [Pirellulaceae bacterium]|jgi:hypothetical protein
MVCRLRKKNRSTKLLGLFAKKQQRAAESKRGCYKATRITSPFGRVEFIRHKQHIRWSRVLTIQGVAKQNTSNCRRRRDDKLGAFALVTLGHGQGHE